MTTTMLRIGAWCVDPKSNEITRNGESRRLEARTMLLLLCLAEHAGEVVSIDELLNRAWPRVNVAPDSVYQAVTSLRRVLGDDPKKPTYIATVPRLGYRMVAKVSAWTDSSLADNASKGQPVDRSGKGPVTASYAVDFFCWLLRRSAFCSSFLLPSSRGKITRHHPHLLRNRRSPSRSCRFLT